MKPHSTESMRQAPVTDPDMPAFHYSLSPGLFLHKLYHWYEKFGRDLPWRKTTDPYAILVSEYMLQQTQVETARAYFLRWMERFPNLYVLAEASEDALLEMWQGLGYYTRVRNLHRTAQALAGLPSFPEQPEELKRLPGMGEYTANAVVAFAFDRSLPVIDANIARVLARISDYSEPIDTPSGYRHLRKVAELLLPARGGRLHNSALMELGALLCKPRRPICQECPIRSHCLSQDPEGQPVKRARKTPQKITDHRAFLCDGEFLWLTRSTGKWWKGLWILPELVEPPSRPCDHSMQFSVTHHRVRMRIWQEAISDSIDLEKIALRHWKNLALPAPHRRGVAAMLAIFHTSL